MKYLMALVVSIGIGASAIAQDYSTDQGSGKGKYRQESDKDKLETGSMDKSAMPSDCEVNCERMSNGSVYYFDDPKDLGEASGKVMGNANMETREDRIQRESQEMELKVNNDATTAVEAEAAPAAPLDKRCELQKMLSDRQGSFKVDRKNDDADFKVEREKDGDEHIKYFTDEEYYYYKKDNDGEDAYSYGKIEGNGRVEVMKNKDGSGSVIYEEYFDDIENSGVLENGFNFKGTAPNCTLNEE